jgi:hypothetical protein
MANPDDLDVGQTIRGFAANDKLFQRYVLHSILGRGGMGIVWRAFDEQLERDVALKFLPEVLMLDRAAMDELKRETKRSLELTHHHIVRIYDFAQDNRTACISMEYVDGQTLSALRVERANKIFEVDELRPLVEHACDALEYAHVKARIVHRDLKPSNLMLNSRGELKVTDFGIARSLSDSVSMLTLRTSGTLIYMSPQQLNGERAHPTDDIYSLGATLYELLSGKPPFYSGGIESQIREKIPPPISDRRSALEIASTQAIPAEWEATIAACLAKDPTQRPPSAAEVAKRLALAAPQYGTTAFSKAPPPGAPPPATLPPAPPAKRKIGPIALIMAALIVCGGLIWYFGFFRPAAAERKAADFRAPEAAANSKAAERLKQARGALIVNTEPQGATITLADQTRKSPASFSDLAVGPAHVRIALEGYEPEERDFEITENRISDSGLIRLKRILGSAKIESVPGSVEFELVDADGGRHSGTTPAVLTNLPTGRAEVIYKNARSVSHSEHINVTASYTVATTWRVPAEPSPTAVAVTSPTPSVAPNTSVLITPDWQTNPTPPPASVSREILGEYTYKGNVGPYEASFRLKFEPGERVTGTYTMPVNKGLVLRLEGRNPTGKMYLDEYTRDRLSAHIELTLNLTANEIRWEGTMYNTPPDNRVFHVTFSRPR